MRFSDLSMKEIMAIGKGLEALQKTDSDYNLDSDNSFLVTSLIEELGYTYNAIESIIDEEASIQSREGLEQ